MQDVDLELIYKGGKDEADPLDSLSRHPLPMAGKYAIGKVVKCVTSTEHAIVMDNNREETLKGWSTPETVRILTGEKGQA